MDKMKIEAIDVLDRIIIGRVEPHIYAFTTNTVPNYLKVGDTYRPVAQRLNEWRVFFPELVKQYENKAVIDDETYFRDYAIHQFLEQDLKRIRLTPTDLEEGIYFSKEFFKETQTNDVDNAIEDIKSNYNDNTGKYEYYSSKNRLPERYHYERGKNWNLRPNQADAVKTFVNAVQNGRKNLLMYAVMRFGKSFTSLCCALEIKASVVLVVSAKADVKDEWKKTVESAGNFIGYIFLEASDLSNSERVIKDKLSEGDKVVVFLTLQDLQGDNIKDKHKQIFGEQIDLLIVDETHFGARAESFGKILRNVGYDKTDEKNIEKLDDENFDVNEAEQDIKKINARIKLHLSGTPYRILMGSEFKKEDIISFVQFSDIVKEQEEWDKNNLNKDEINEWDNPYYGFPQMVRFAFNPNKSSRAKIEALKKSGVSFAFSKLLEPMSIKKDTTNNDHKKFVNECEILDLLKVIDGSKEDEDLLGFLDYDKIKEGKMCRHMVMVLPYCASCDAMEELVKTNKTIFKNLSSYEIINISGVESHKEYKKPNDVKNKIKECESQNQKTLTLTVNRMLTGSTVEQWDTMLYFKDTASPQEYDQSIFRLQNQYVRTLSSDKGFIKENLKPQTLLVDFDPDRLFRMQEQKSLIYNVNTDENGNSKLKERIIEELRISPIIMMNHNKIKEVNATNILEAVSEYNNQRSVSDEVLDIPVDLSILNDDDIRKAIESQAEFNSKQGLTIDPSQGEGDELDIDESNAASDSKGDEKAKGKEEYSETKTDNETKKLESQIKTYYQRLLFFSFLTKDKVSSLDDILSVIDRTENSRLAKNLFLEKDIVRKISKTMDAFKRSSLDYKIQNISMLASDESVEPLTRAMTSMKKFNRMSESEVITPSKVCDDMVKMLPEDGLREIVKHKDKLLDIASKSGEYAVSLYNRLTSELGYSHDDIKDIIYSIPTSSTAYEFTRRFYEILNLNVDNIANNFNAYDLIDVKNDEDEVDYEKIISILRQKKTFSKITFKDEIKAGDKTVKFGVVIGNPPYQDNIENRGEQPAIYNFFYDLAEKIGDKYCLISPARFLFNVGSTPKSWNEIMLSDKHIEVVYFNQKASDLFSNTDIKGGVAILYRDSVNTIGPIGTFTSYNELNGIVKKIVKGKFDSIGELLHSNTSYKYTPALWSENQQLKGRVSGGSRRYLSSSVFDKLHEVFYEEKPKDGKEYVQILGRQNNHRIFKWIRRDYLVNHPNIDKFKVLIPSSNGSGHLGEVLSTPIIEEPNQGHTETFISFGTFDNKQEAENLLKYVKTKFARTMLGVVKVTQGNKTKEVWSKVPLQDFTSKSDIDWRKSIPEIDQQLYKKYGLEQKEIAFIEEKVKAMD